MAKTERRVRNLSDAFEENRAALEADKKSGADPEDPDEYRADNIFWVPKDARWLHIQGKAKQPTVGKLVDDAMVAIERDNPTLKGVLPKDYARPALDKQRLGELVDLIGTIGLGDKANRSRDVLGRVYEYFLSSFASAEGKKGGQFYTPQCIVRVLVTMLAPYRGRVYDPCCGSGGMFVQSEKFVEAHGGRIGDISIYGQDSNPTTWRLAKMNLAIRGIDANLGAEWADTFHRDLHKDLKADYVLANPPFNDSDWGGQRLRDDVRRKYGIPPAGNANFGWVQHFIHHLSPTGLAGFVLANGSMSSQQSGEGEIRKAIVEADLVDCMVALPGQLFYSTQIPVCLWFLSRDKKAAADKALDDFYIAKAKVIKELLISSRSTTYNNYDKRRFRQAIELLDPTSRQVALLQDDEKTKLRSQKDAHPKAALSTVDRDVPDFPGVTASAEELLKRSVVSQVIDALASDREVGTWVRKGLALHTGARMADECRFCGQKVPPARITALKAHFNDAFVQFQAETDSLAAEIEDQRKRLAQLALPESSRLYHYLAADVEAALATTRALLDSAAAYLESLHARLMAKRESPFAPEWLKSPVMPDRNAILQAMATMNEVIEKHNSTTRRFQDEVEAASQTLEQCYVAEAYDEFIRLRDATKTADDSATTAAKKTGELREQIAAIEREIVEHRRPAEELNAELHAYLGRAELCFEVKEAGYSMTRSGQPASDLSEGEKTAIAFLYFLKSLQDKSFDLANGVVVIDDPVSSLDANALFSAFGYMKERTKDAGQLFVLTHNFCFFRQVKTWFDYLLKRKDRQQRQTKPASYYLLQASARDGHRRAALVQLDQLLDDYDSEYHYIFKRVYEESQRDTNAATLETHYEMPNVARRLLEAFLSFRFPSRAGEFYQQLIAVPFDPGKKARILRFLNTHSHHGHVAEPEHDLSVLSETGAVLGDVLALIEATDAEHFRGMKELVSGVRETEVA